MVVLQWVCSCGQRHDFEAFLATVGAGAPRPTPGDVGLCRGCGEAFTFRDGATPARVPWHVCAQLMILAGEWLRLGSFSAAREQARRAN